MKKMKYYCTKHHKKVHPKKAGRACVSCPYFVQEAKKQTQREEEYK